MSWCKLKDYRNMKYQLISAKYFQLPTSKDIYKMYPLLRENTHPM